VGISKSINKTRLKVKLLGHFYDQCQEESDGKNTVLAFKKNLSRFPKF
jgi:hypothetical protein